MNPLRHLAGHMVSRYRKHTTWCGVGARATEMRRDSSILPQPFETAGRHLGVPFGVLQLHMPQISRQAQRIGPAVDEIKATGVAQQMRMHTINPCLVGRLLQKLVKAVARHRRAAVRYEYESRSDRVSPP